MCARAYVCTHILSHWEDSVCMVRLCVWFVCVYGSHSRILNSARLYVGRNFVCFFSRLSLNTLYTVIMRGHYVCMYVCIFANTFMHQVLEFSIFIHMLLRTEVVILKTNTWACLWECIWGHDCKCEKGPHRFYHYVFFLWVSCWYLGTSLHSESSFMV